MNCEPARGAFSLYIYGELSFDEEERIEQHLEECEGCRRELQREKSMHEAMTAAELSPAPGLLAESRRQLRAGLRAASRQSGETQAGGWFSRFSITVRRSLRPEAGWLKPAGAVALVALGFFSARFTAVGPASAPRTTGGDAVVSRVRYVEPVSTGGVRIVVDETRQRTLSGKIEDEPIQKLLLAAARDPSDPGLRADSMDLLKNKWESQEVHRVLLYALEHDPNPGVRLKAMEGLKSFSGDAESRRVLSRVLLRDDNPGVRTQAIDLLVQHKQNDIVGTLQELLRKEENGYVRLRSQNALRAMNASVETF